MQGQKDLYKLLLRQMASVGDVYTMTTFGQGHGYACPIKPAIRCFIREFQTLPGSGAAVSKEGNPWVSN